ncbi:MAG: OmpA family protein [Cyclobacteriaceae bacterium]|nr:OmpA family protein [Cyclobacteriaceae bacterium]
MERTRLLRKVSTLLLGIMVVVQAYGQEYVLYNDEKQEAPQEMVLVYGHILDAASNKPVKGHINFEKMPRANNVGFISNKENGSYQLHMLENRKYTLEITAEGYITVFDIVDIEDIDADGQIKKDFLLTAAADGNVLRMNNLLFELGQAQILKSSYDELNSLAQMLYNNPKMKIQLEGHTDFRGNPERNMKLSEDRVIAVREYLMAQNVRKNRIKLKAFGGSQPITTDKSEEAKMKNRRVEVRILSK